MVLAIAVVGLCVGLAPQLFAVAQDQEFARVAGLRVRFYNVLVAVLAAVSVTVAMRTVGLLLVSALMVVPVATSQQLTRSFRTTIAAAMALGTLASVGGLADRRLRVVRGSRGARPDDRPAGPRRLSSSRGRSGSGPGTAPRLREPFPPGELPEHETCEEHPHDHGPGCGHLAVPHDDHVDYVHDGHRHAAHGAHYDEH